ncbi:MAG: 50S ribosomal protein L21 [Chloroflexota bacterium]
MYAVVRTGGKQYRITAGDILEVEKLEGEVGETITLDDVLLVSNEEKVVIGQPTVENASVEAVISGQYRGPKILSFRYRPKKRIRVRRGHRQYVTRLEIESVSLDGTVFTRPVPSPEPTAESIEEDAALLSAVDSEETQMGDIASSIAGTSAVVGEMTRDATDAAEEVADEVVSEAGDAVEEASDAVEETIDDANDTVEEASDAIEEAAAEASDAVEDVADDAIEAANKAVSDAGDNDSSSGNTDSTN